MNLDRLRKNVDGVRERIARACASVGRSPEDLVVIAVTKERPPEAVEALLKLGLRNIGENRVQDAAEKKPIVTLPARWHMIGHLQSNKSRGAIDTFDTIHTVDRPSLAQELHKLLFAEARKMEIFVQVNVAGEKQKSGLPPDDVSAFVDTIRDRYPSLSPVGLMTLAPVTDEAGKVRWVFSRLRELSVQVGLTKLSMGMSQDYAVAIEEGATHLRIGTAFFAGVIGP